VQGSGDGHPAATGIAHKGAGIGMVGAGVLRAPEKCFAEAFEVVGEW